MFSYLSTALDLILPPKCPSCSAIVSSDRSFCECCEVSLIPIPSPCRICAEPETPKNICKHCAKVQPNFEKLYVPHLYGGYLQDAIYAFKYQGKTHLAKDLAQLWQPLYEILKTHYDLMIPVPLHRNQLIKRGYNQAALLANELHKTIDLPINTSVIRKIKNTPPQAGLDAKARRKNLHAAFSLTKRFSSSNDLSNKRILIVDDVCTTTATLNACAASLSIASPKSIGALCLARTTLNHHD